MEIPKTDEDFKFYIVSEFGELKTANARLEGKLDTVITTQEAANDVLKDHESRIRSAEKKIYWFSGLGAFIAFAARSGWEKVMRGHF